ncbi:DUF2267 domain-containing protein [Natronococcus occultus]|uniref:DUF2267 domain-containing protein n=1 Tax=Natronococcus occultus SP4 TaxID=694430 RepID=L0K2Z5_9EURY|nr:DUF2267 domain-containing protein [Natronococcus occultus]AGB39361.1 hypothetical protein Natoc_3645 [Natronococcus occultus SP4]
MQYDDFIGEVQQRAQLDSREAALSVSRATLTTLSERIDPGQAENLAAQLPDELARFLEDVDDAERFGHGEFVDRVGDREEIDGADAADAAFHARVVVDVLEEAVTGDALEDVKTQLPTDKGYEDLFEVAESDGSPA